MDLYKRYSLSSSLIISLAWIIVLSIIISLNTKKSTNFLHIGPCNNTNFIDLKIDTWGKWFLTMMYSFFSQFINSYINATLYPFMVNVIRDYKSEWRDTMLKAQIITFIYKLYYWFHEICEIFLVLTLQLQYYIPALLADLIVGAFTTRKYIKDKRKDIQHQYDSYHQQGYNRV